MARRIDLSQKRDDSNFHMNRNTHPFLYEDEELDDDELDNDEDSPEYDNNEELYEYKLSQRNN